MLCLVLIQGQQEIEGRLHLLALALAKIEEGQLAGRGLVQHLGHGSVRNRQSSATRLKRVAGGGSFRTVGRGPAGHPWLKP